MNQGSAADAIAQDLRLLDELLPLPEGRDEQPFLAALTGPDQLLLALPSEPSWPNAAPGSRRS